MRRLHTLVHSRAGPGKTRPGVNSASPLCRAFHWLVPVDDRGVVPWLVPGPPGAAGVAVLGGANLADQLRRAVVADDREHGGPAEQVVLVGDSGGSVAEQGNAAQPGAGKGGGIRAACRVGAGAGRSVAIGDDKRRAVVSVIGHDDRV